MNRTVNHFLRTWFGGIHPGIRTVATAALGLVLVACASKPPVPDWEINAHAAAHKAIEAALRGSDRVARLEWERARAEVASTARPDLLARLELLRCATQVAHLEPAPCPAFEALRAGAVAAEIAYAEYLAGRDPGPKMLALLPESQRKAALAGSPEALKSIDDPLSRLVAAGVLLRKGEASPALAEIAVQTASAQGWRRPLMAWLLLQLQHAQAAGDSAQVARLRLRLAIVAQQPLPPP